MSNIIPHPISGEVIELDATTDVLADAIENLRILRQQISHTIDTLSDEINDRLDAENTRTAHVGGWTITGKPGTVTDYDPVRLHAALCDLAAAGVISDAVVERTVLEPPVKDWKVSKTEANKLLRHADERVRRAVQECAVLKAQKRSVTVARAA